EWDFSESEWAEIEASIKAAREAPLSEKDRAELRGAANDFRFNRDFRETENYSPKRRMNLWKKVAQLSGRLREAFEIACKARYGRTMAITPRQENNVLVDLLKTVEENALELGTNPILWSVSMIESYTGRLDPSVIFYQH